MSRKVEAIEGGGIIDKIFFKNDEGLLAYGLI
jgi:hypothetical protein